MQAIGSPIHMHTVPKLLWLFATSGLEAPLNSVTNITNQDLCHKKQRYGSNQLNIVSL